MSHRPLARSASIRHAGRVTDLRVPAPPTGDDPAGDLSSAPASVTDERRRLHPAWIVAGVGFVALLGAAAFRSVPSVLIEPLHTEFGWSHATISTAISLNMLLYGLISPFAAALMDRFGIRKVVCSALVLIAAGSGLTVLQ